MASVVFALVLLLLVIGIGVAFAWQESRGSVDSAVIYGVEDALDFVYPRLADATRNELKRADVRKILEWELKYLQNPAVRGHAEEPTVVGGINAARYAQDELLAVGLGYDGQLILDVLERQAEYLAALGAIGPAVEGTERRIVLERSGDDPGV